MTERLSEPDLPLRDIIAIGAVSDGSSFDEKWRTLTSADAPFVRAAKLKANELAGTTMNPGQAYLQCLADLAHFHSQSRMAGQVHLDIHSLPETPMITDVS